MLKPFQIRDLHGSPTQEDAYNSLNCLPQGHYGQSTSGRSGIVQLSASDYDEIALSHPRARLTYVDDDDGEIITVSVYVLVRFTRLVSNTCTPRLDHLLSFLNVWTNLYMICRPSQT